MQKPTCLTLDLLGFLLIDAYYVVCIVERGDSTKGVWGEIPLEMII